MPSDGIVEIRSILEKAEEVEWPDPEPLFEPTEGRAAYPLDALPPIITEAVKQYRAYGQQPLPLIACSALASVSLAAQGLVDVARDRHLQVPSACISPRSPSAANAKRPPIGPSINQSVNG